MSVSIEPHLWVSDLSASIGWYRDVLGFDVTDWFPDEDGATWCQMRHGEASIMLAVVPDRSKLADHQLHLGWLPERIEGPGGPLALYLHVGDADARHTAAATAGAEMVEEIWDAWWGGRQFTVADPDGHWWTVFQASE